MIFGYSWKTIFCTKHETNGRILIWIQVSVLDPDLQHCFYHSTFLFCSEEGKFDFLLNDHNDYGVFLPFLPPVILLKKIIFLCVLILLETWNSSRKCLISNKLARQLQECARKWVNIEYSCIFGKFKHL